MPTRPYAQRTRPSSRSRSPAIPHPSDRGPDGLESDLHGALAACRCGRDRRRPARTPSARGPSSRSRSTATRLPSDTGCRPPRGRASRHVRLASGSAGVRRLRRSACARLSSMIAPAGPAAIAATTTVRANVNRRLRRLVDIERRETVGGRERAAAHTDLVCSERSHGSQRRRRVYPSTEIPQPVRTASTSTSSRRTTVSVPTASRCARARSAVSSASRSAPSRPRRSE